ncbi:MAG: protein BatD [Deltaproteobacteria bacterium]|nr:protein BatD [Deltaproteobacteria bacterium]
MVRTLIVSFVVAVCIGLPGLARAQSVTLVCDRPIVALNGSATVEVVVQGGTNITGNPSFPRSNGFALAFAGQSSSFQMARGSVSQSVTYSYRLTAKTVGDWTLGPAEVSMGGKKLKSAQLELKVVKGNANANSAAAAPPAGAEHYARARVSNPTPYVGEAFTWFLEVGSSGRVRQPSLPGLPDFDGLSSEPGIEPQWTNTRVMRDGRRLEVFTAGLPVFAVESGTTTIGRAAVTLPEVLRGQGLFARVRDLQLEAKAVPVSVRALPARKPKDFSGAVGRFTLRATPDTTEVNAGETLTLTVRLSGTGALRAPELVTNLPDTLRVYDEDPDVQVSLVDGEVHSRAIFRKAIVPLEPGTFTVPPLRFTYFDPTSGSYQTAASTPIVVQVTGAAVAEPTVARSEGIAAGKEGVEILASDILPLRTGDRLMGRQGVGLGSPIILALLLLPLLGFGGAAALRARDQAAGSDRGRRAALGKEAKAALKRAGDAAKSGSHEEAEKAVRDWLTTRMERSGASLSAGEAAAALTSAGCPAALAQGLSALLERSEGVRYGGESPGTLADDYATWVAAAQGGWR